MGYQIRHLPADVGPAEAYDTLIAAVRSGGTRPLPKGYDVEWKWRNAKHLPLQDDEFTKVVRESARGGFREIMIERLEQDRALAIEFAARIEANEGKGSTDETDNETGGRGTRRTAGRGSKDGRTGGTPSGPPRPRRKTAR